MLLVIQIAAGPETGRRIVSGGEVRRVGRGAAADEPVADGYLSEVHFAVYWHDGVPWVRDLGSRNGTFVNRVAVTETPLRDGDQLFAGQTTFAVRVEAAAPRPSQPPEPSRPRSVVDALGDLGPSCYAVLDAARDPAVLPLVRDSGETWRSLYDGWQGEALAEVAPYLVEVPPASPFLATLVARGWGRAWGIFLVSDRSLLELRRHLRRFLRAETDDGEVALFRYYDPRVLRRYLPTCTREERRAFFGPITGFALESRRGDALLRFGDGEDALVEEAVPVFSPEGSMVTSTR